MSTHAELADLSSGTLIVDEGEKHLKIQIMNEYTEMSLKL